MKLLRWGEKRGVSDAGAARGGKCDHPVSHQVALYEDSADPRAITGMKCSQCGQRLPLKMAA